MTDGPERLESKWADRDYPVLREIVRLMDDNVLGGVRSLQVEAALPSLSPEDIQRETSPAVV